MRKSLMLLLLLPLLLGQSYNVPFNPPAVVGGGTAVSDDFNRGTGLGADWIQTMNTWTLISSAYVVPSGTLHRTMYYNPASLSDDQWACTELQLNMSTNTVGVVLRASSPTSGFYVTSVRASDGDVFAQEWDSGPTFDDYSELCTSTGAVSAGSIVCFSVSGTGASTRFQAWVNVCTDTADCIADQATWTASATGRICDVTQAIGSSTYPDTGDMAGLYSYDGNPQFDQWSADSIP